MQRPNYIPLAWAIAVVFLVSACALLPPKPETPREALAAAEISFTAVVETAITLREDGFIDGDSEIGQRITTFVVAGNSALDAAQAALAAGDDFSSYLGILKSTTAALSSIVANLGEQT